MAGDWIKFEIATPEKPEVWQIADDLDLDPDAVIGKLMRLWVWFDQHTEDGNAPIVTKKLLDRSVGVNGFCDSVVAVGWMEETTITIGLPNFERHNGKTAKNRALTAKRVALHKAKSNEKGNGEVTEDALPREEKRREEKKDKESGSRTGNSLVTFTGWLKRLDEEGEKPIPSDDNIFEYVDNAGIPHDWLRAAWVEFKAEFTDRDKRYKDWRAAFRNYVRKNYYKLWWVDAGEYKLTSRGQQAMMAIRGSETNAN